MIAKLSLLSRQEDTYAYRLEIPGRPDVTIEVYPQDIIYTRSNLEDTAIRKAMALMELLELPEPYSIKLNT